MADTAFNLTFNSSTGKVSVSRATAPNIDAAGPLGGEFTTLTPSQTVRMRKALDGVTGGYAAAELHYMTVVNNANIYNSIIDENGVDAPELSTARQVLEASNLVQPGFGGGMAAALQAQWALEIRAEYDEGLADIGVSPEDRASIIDKVVADILGQGLPVTPETFDDAFDRHPEAQQYIQEMEDSGGAEKITKESPETGGNVVYYVAPDGTLSKTKVISYNPDNGETGSADVVTADYKFIDGKWVRDASLGDTTINQSAEEFMQQLQGSGFTSLAEAVAASLRIQRSHVMEPEEPIVPSTPTETGTGGGNNNDDDDDDDTAAVVVAPVEPITTEIVGDPVGQGGAVTTYKDRVHIQDGNGHTGRGTQAPVILDLDGDGVEVTFGEDIYFDLDDDGFLEQTSWASADDGFLVIDKLANDVRDTNGSDGWGDGVIDQSNELVLSSLGLEGDTDLQALARYDDNGDGKLDSGDAIWSELKVWQDLNQDGKTEGDGTELKTLAAWGISSINLAYDDGTDFTDESNDVEVFGNILHGLASFTMNGNVVTGGVGDMTLAYNTRGWREIELTDGGGAVIGYSIEFEGWKRFDYAVATASTAADFDLTALELDGATGDDRNNVLDATGSLKAVTISGGVGNDTLLGGWDDDMIAGGVGADVIRGYGGNDVLFFDAADTVVSGGDGVDVAYATDEDIVDENGVVTTAAAGVVLHMDNAGIEAVYGGDGDDVLDVANTGYGTALSMNGGKGDDTLTSGAADDTLSGDAGDDTLSGNAGDDTLIGGAGEDTITGGSGADFILGGTENDTLNAGVGDDFVLGGTGDDTIDGGSGDDYLDGGAGSDTIVDGDGDDFVIGGGGYDIITSGSGDDYVDAGAGNDTISDGLGDDVYKGGDGDDVLTMVAGQIGKDVFFGGTGNDTAVLAGNRSEYDWSYKESGAEGKGQYSIWKVADPASADSAFYLVVQDVEHLQFDDQTVDLADVDVTEDNSADYREMEWLDADLGGSSLLNVDTGAGDDVIDVSSGSTNADIIATGAGDDIVISGKGADTIIAGSGADIVYAGENDDTITGGSGNDELAGGDGADTITGGEGNDTIIGDGSNRYDLGSNGAQGSAEEDDRTNVENGGAADILDGGAGEDTILGGKGNDTIHGDDGADFVNAGIGDDTVYGDSGADQLFGGDGADTIHGGLGDDYIVADSGYSLDVTVHLVRFLTKGSESKSVTKDRVTEMESGYYSVKDLINGYLWDVYGSTAGTPTMFSPSPIRDVSNDDLDLSDQAFLTDILPRIYGRAATAAETSFWQVKLDNGATYAAIVMEAIEQAVVDPAKVQSFMVLFDEYTTAEAAALSFDDTVYGDEGDDEIYAGKGDDTVEGGIGHDKLHGGAGDDALTGGAGSDKLLGGMGDDTLTGGEGADVLEGGHGADVIHGDNAANNGQTNPFDTLSYEGSDEGVNIDLLNSTASGGDAEGDTFDGIEWVAGSEYDDDLTGDTGDNRLFGNGGHDDLAGGTGNDHLYGGTGHDLLNGDAGDDRLYGDDGDDKIKGAAGDDLLVGGAGDDILIGGDGTDVLVGDDGNDVFMLQNGGQDTVEDFTIGADTIGIWGNIADITLSQDGDDTLVVSGSSSMRLSGVIAAELSEADFTLFRDGTGVSETLDYSASTSRVNADGKNWHDTITGSDFDDTIRGGHGNDVMQGGLGNDKYIIDLDMWGSHHQDTITDSDGTNTIRVDGSIKADDITAVNSGNNLTLTFGSTGKSVTITDQWLDLDAPAVEFLELSSGETIDIRTFHGNGGDDTLDGTASADTLNGYVGNDVIDGGAGDDTLYGGEGNDRLTGGSGVDTLYGGDGDDYIADGAGAGTMHGGEGIDTVDVSHTSAASVIDLVAGTVDWGSSNIETATNFENVVGSQGVNTILGTDDSNVLDGQGGSDTLNGGLGRDTLMGGAGNDIYAYNIGDGSDVIIEGDFGAHMSEGYDDDGGTNNNEGDLDGGSYDPDAPLASEQEAGSDKIVFGTNITQSDLTFSDIGDDLFIHLPDGATITIKGFVNQKVETLEFADGSTMDLTNRGDVTWTGKNKTWFTSGVDNYFGGEGNDTLNAISGHDTVQGGGGNDTIDGGSRNDNLYGGSGNDTLFGGSGDDIIYGDSGDDRIQGNGDADFMDGGVGVDTLVRTSSTADVDIDLEAGTTTKTVVDDEETTITVETIRNFENVEAGSGNNNIKGTNEVNVIDGGAGDDVIEAGAGDDTLTGGTGANTYVFSRGDGMDTITDFNANTDTLRIEGAAIANITIDYNGSGVLITYGTDAEGNPVDQVFLDGVPASVFGLADIVTTANVASGSNSADIYVGTDAHEDINMNGGNDDITAGGGNDDIDAGAGADTVHAGTGNDKVTGGTGADLIYLDAGNDIFVDDAETSATGNDVVHGGDGNDLFLGEGGDDTFYGEAGNDTLNGGAGNDTLIGDAGTAEGKLIATYYRLSNTVNSVQDIPVLTEADGVRIASDLDVNALAVELGGRGDYYGVRYVGVIDVSTAGDYTFKTGSDDGSQLWIDGELVVDNDGLHGMVYQSGVVSGLTAGQHEIEIRYFEKAGGNTLTTTVQGPDTSAVELDIFASGMLGDASASSDAPTGLGLEDILNGGAGNDTLTGGSGADIIELDFGSGSDTMTDFEDGLDIIDLSATGLSFADLTITANGSGDAVISFDDGDGATALDELTLTGITTDKLTAEDFQFG